MSDEKAKKMAIEGIKPPKKDDPAYDYVGVLLEAVQSDFKIFGEGLEFVKQKVETTFEELGRFKEETAENFARVWEKFDRVDERFNRIELRLDRIEAEVRSIKNELQELKHTLTNKTDIEKFQELEKRVMRIEEALKLKMTNS